MNSVFRSHGDGLYHSSDFKEIGENVIIENQALVFHPENIILGNNIYIGHQTILKGYYKNSIKIGDNTWIGQQCFFHGGGGIIIHSDVGIGPKVSILTSQHRREDQKANLLASPLEFKEVEIGEGSDIGVGSVILPGVKIGKGAIVGAGAVVNKDIPDYECWVGVPAKKI